MTRSILSARPARRAITLAAAAALATLGAAPGAQAAYQFTFLGGVPWGASDAQLGLAAGAQIENFEDTTLIPGLSVQLGASSSGSYGPTGTLPRVFAPGADPYGNAFIWGTWDGSHALLNTGNNASAPYSSSSAWGDVTLGFGNGGARQVGFSLQNMQQAASFTINGSTVVPTGSIANFVYSWYGQGYLRIDVTGNSAPITSLKIDGTIYDAWTVDHLAVTAAVPEPQSWALLAGGLLAVLGLARRRAAAPLRVADGQVTGG